MALRESKLARFVTQKHFAPVYFSTLTTFGEMFLTNKYLAWLRIHENTSDTLVNFIFELLAQKKFCYDRCYSFSETLRIEYVASHFPAAGLRKFVKDDVDGFRVGLRQSRGCIVFYSSSLTLVSIKLACSLLPDQRPLL